MTQADIIKQLQDLRAFSPCRKAQVACVLIVGDKVFTGVNTLDRNTLKPLECSEDCKCGKALHAEMQALQSYLSSNPEITSSPAQLHVTRQPCEKCLKALHGALGKFEFVVYG